MFLKNNSRAFKVKGKITNLFSYTYRIRLEAEIIKASTPNFIHLIGEYNIEAGPFVGKVSIYKTKGEILFGQILKELSTSNTEMEEIKFDLINLREIGDEIIEEGEFSYKGSSLEFKEWSIKLKLRSNYKTIYDELREYGGFVVTHSVSVYRNDNSYFNYDEVLPILEKLYSYLAFICGRRVYPFSYEGIISGDKVFMRYESRLIDQWSISNTWYPKIDKEIYNDLFRSFCSIWEDSSWNQSKNVLLGTYLECFSNVTLENRITSIQIALELISQIYLVNYKRKLSGRRFKSIDTKERIRNTFTDMEIPLEEPEQFLRRNNDEFFDPVSFFVDVRNSIIHSKRKIDLSHDNLKYAYYIGLWLLELSLLKVFNYQGKYKNRLSKNNWEGDAKYGGCYYAVPWRELPGT
jgi:hypothetical protein